MSKVLKHTKTGQLFPYSTQMAQRADLEVVETKEAKPTGSRSQARKAKAQAKPQAKSESVEAVSTASADDLLGDLDS